MKHACNAAVSMACTVATKESWSRDASILPKHFTYIYIVEQAMKKSKIEKGYKFLFENYCHDDYWRLIWTRNSCRGECFKSLRKNERPHNVNSCDKCSRTAEGNGYCNHMFLLYKCLNSLNSPRTRMCTTQGPRVRTLIHIMHTRHTRNTCIAEPREVQGGEPIRGGWTGEKWSKSCNWGGWI